jgi:hypothetical protein
MTDLTTQYRTSKAYNVLYWLAKHQPVICLIGKNQNIGVTNYHDSYPDRVTILSIGYCFICGEDIKSFMANCELEDVKWLVPHHWEVYSIDEGTENDD